MAGRCLLGGGWGNITFHEAPDGAAGRAIVRSGAFVACPSSLSDSGFSGQLRWPFRRMNAGAGSPVGS